MKKNEILNTVAQIEKYLQEKTNHSYSYKKQLRFIGYLEVSLEFLFLGEPIKLWFCEDKKIKVFAKCVTKDASGFREMSPETFISFFEHLK